MSRTILVHGDKKFQIEIPDDAEMTFGPWSPPPRGEERALGGAWNGEQRRGTLRVYSAKKAEILAVFAGVTSFRDISAISYREEVMKMEGDTVWKSDKDGYEHHSTQRRERYWESDTPSLPAAQSE